MARVPAKLLFGFVLALVSAAVLLQSSSAQQPDPGKATTERTPASLQKDLDVLEKTLQAQLAADDAAIRDRQEAHNKDLESEPLIPDTPNVPTANDFLGEQYEYRRRVVVAYGLHGMDPVGARAGAAAFLEAYVRYASQQPGAQTASEVSKLGEAAVAAGSRDAIVATYHARIRDQLQEVPLEDTLSTYRAILDGLADGEYPPPLVRFQLEVWGNEGLRLADVPAMDKSALRKKAFEAAERFLASDAGRTSPAVAHALAKGHLYSKVPKAEERRELYEVCLKSGRIDPWILHMLAGEYYYRVAWDYRGSGFSNTVTPEGWEKFQQYLPRAGQHFKRAWFLHPELAEAASRLIEVANASKSTGWRAEQWFHETVKAQVDLPDAYEHYSWSLMPRWGGTQKQLVDFARRCLLSNRWDTAVPRQALHVLRNLRLDVEKGERPGRNPQIAELSAVYLDAMLKAIADSRITANEYANDLAVVTAYLIEAGDFTRARTSFQAAGDDDTWAWTVDQGVGYRYAMGLAYAATGPAAELVAPLHEALFVRDQESVSVEDCDRLSGELKQAQTKDNNPRAAWFYKVGSEMLAQRRRYAAGEWVELRFDPEMSGWLTQAAKVECIDDRTALLRCYAGRNGMCLKPLVTFQPPFIIEAEVNTVSLIDDYAYTGIIYNAPNWTSKEFPQALSTGEWIRVGQMHLGGSKDKSYRRPFVTVTRPPEDGFIPIALRVWPGVLEFRGLGKRVHLDSEFTGPTGSYFHFGNILNAGSAAEAFFRNLRIRKLTSDPPAANSPDDYVAEAPAAPPKPAAAMTPATRLQLAERLMHSAQLEQARTQIELVLNHRPPLPGAERVNGDIYYREQNYGAARDAYAREVKWHPSDDYARVLLAWVLACAPEDNVRDGAQAVAIMKEVQRRSAGQFDQYPTYRSAFAAALAEIKDFEGAKTQLNALVEQNLQESERDRVKAIRSVLDDGKPYRLPAKAPKNDQGLEGKSF